MHKLIFTIVGIVAAVLAFAYIQTRYTPIKNDTTTQIANAIYDNTFYLIDKSAKRVVV